MEKDIMCGKHLCIDAIIDGTQFINVGLKDGVFDNMMMENARFNNINMTGANVNYVNLEGSKFTECYLKNVEIEGSETKGMKIDGILVSDMIAAYERAQQGTAADRAEATE